MGVATRPGSWLRGSKLRRAASAVGRRIDLAGRALAGRLIDALAPAQEDISHESLRGVRRVLVVRPNFRLGNALITSPLVLALRERFPDAEIDYLGGEGTLQLLDGLPIAGRHVMSRGFVLRPWSFVALFVRLRRRSFDVAVDAAMGSFSGGLYSFLSGARYRIGIEGRGDRFLNVRLPRPSAMRVYDGPVEFARLLGVACVGRPIYVVQAAEKRAAQVTLEEAGLASDGVVDPFVSLFVGGHGRKRRPLGEWIELARALDASGERVAVFVGPEERSSLGILERELGEVAAVIPPQPLRAFAAMLAEAKLVVTPDSGPMHLAAALGVPIVAVLAREESRFFVPQGRGDVALVLPSVAKLVDAVLQAQSTARVTAMSALPPSGSS